MENANTKNYYRELLGKISPTIGVLTGLLFAVGFYLVLSASYSQYPLTRFIVRWDLLIYFFVPFPFYLIITYIIAQRLHRPANIKLVALAIAVSSITVMLAGYGVIQTNTFNDVFKARDFYEYRYRTLKYETVELKKAAEQKIANASGLHATILLQYLESARATQADEVKISSDFIKYTNEELGFSFWYPSSWGEVIIEHRVNCADVSSNNKYLQNDTGFYLTFSGRKDARIGSIHGICNDRPQRHLDRLWSMRGDPQNIDSQSYGSWSDPADEQKELAGGQQLSIWYSQQNPIGERDLEASAGLAKNPSYPGIGFISPSLLQLGRPDAADEDVRERFNNIVHFLTLIRSFELIP